MEFITYTSDGDVCLANLEKKINSLKLEDDFRLKEKIQSCPVQVYLVGSMPTNRPIVLENETSEVLIQKIHSAWMALSDFKQNQATRELHRLFLMQNLTRTSKDVVQANILLYKIHRNLQRPSYIILVRQQDQLSLAPIELRQICLMHQMDTQFIPFHSSGVFHKKSLFLFSGPSGAGKTTIARLSQESGDDFLDLDQVMIHSIDGHSYSANAWGSDFTESAVPIRAIFEIKKDDHDRLLPLTQMRTFRLICEQSMEVTAKNLPKSYYRDLYERIGHFARSVPGYELHFRKSPDFWKLIDAEIPID